MGDARLSAGRRRCRYTVLDLFYRSELDDTKFRPTADPSFSLFFPFLFLHLLLPRPSNTATSEPPTVPRREDPPFSEKEHQEPSPDRGQIRSLRRCDLGIPHGRGFRACR